MGTRLAPPKYDPTDATGFGRGSIDVDHAVVTAATARNAAMVMILRMWLTSESVRPQVLA